MESFLPGAGLKAKHMKGKTGEPWELSYSQRARRLWRGAKFQRLRQRPCRCLQLPLLPLVKGAGEPPGFPKINDLGRPSPRATCPSPHGMREPFQGISHCLNSPTLGENPENVQRTRARGVNVRIAPQCTPFSPISHFGRNCPSPITSSFPTPTSFDPMHRQIYRIPLCLSPWFSLAAFNYETWGIFENL